MPRRAPGFRTNRHDRSARVDIANLFFPDLVKSIESAAFERGFNTILLNTNYDANRAADYVRRLIGLKVAGVALMTAELDPR